MKLFRNSRPPEIPVLSDSPDRPLWSVMIPTHNCANTLERTLRSVLNQDPGRAMMQIQVVDDCSNKDDPEAVVRRIAGDRVEFTRQERNQGHANNFNSCIINSRGRLVHNLHGDDWVKDSFYVRLQSAFETDASVGAAFCRSIYIGHDDTEAGVTDLELEQEGVIDDWLVRILRQQRVCTPSMVVRREVYERLGGFDPGLGTAEDWEMWVRIAAHYPVWYEPTALACYRLSRPGSLTGLSHQTTRIARNMRRACNTIQARLQPIIADRKLEPHLTAARLFYAGWSLNYAQQAIQTEGLVKVLPHLKEAYLCYPTRWMARRIFRVIRRRSLD